MNKITIIRGKVNGIGYIYYTADLSLSGIDLQLLLPRKYFVSHLIKKALRQRLAALQREGIPIPEGITNKTNIKIIKA